MKRTSLLVLYVIAVFVLGCGNNIVKPTHDFDDFEDFYKENSGIDAIHAWIILNTNYHEPSFDFANFKGNDEVEKRVTYFLHRRGGVCTDFASVYVLGARRTGKECGFIFEVYDFFSHIRGWIKYEDGSITETSSKNIYKSKHKNYQAMLNYYEQRWNGSYYLYDNKNEKCVLKINKRRKGDR